MADKIMSFLLLITMSICLYIIIHGNSGDGYNIFILK